jgi:hypothetical protein
LATVTEEMPRMLAASCTSHDRIAASGWQVEFSGDASPRVSCCTTESLPRRASDRIAQLSRRLERHGQPVMRVVVPRLQDGLLGHEALITSP